MPQIAICTSQLVNGFHRTRPFEQHFPLRMAVHKIYLSTHRNDTSKRYTHFVIYDQLHGHFIANNSLLGEMDIRNTTDGAHTHARGQHSRHTVIMESMKRKLSVSALKLRTLPHTLSRTHTHTLTALSIQILGSLRKDAECEHFRNYDCFDRKCRRNCIRFMLSLMCAVYLYGILFAPFCRLSLSPRKNNK